MMQNIFLPGEKKNLPKKLNTLLKYYSVAVAVYIFVAVFIYPEPMLHRSLSFGMFYSLLFLRYSSPGFENSKTFTIIDYGLALISVTISLYIYFNIDRLLDRRIYIDPVLMMDKVMFVLTVSLIIEGGRRVLGFWLPALSVISLLYLFLGHNLIGKLSHPEFGLSRVTDILFMTPGGLWDSTLGLASGVVMVFILFGVFLLKSGAGDFLFEFASLFFGKTKGGIAKVAVLSSALFGMISSGPVTNVSTTGNLTIPKMIKNGYPKDFAAATESCASIGGMFTPPVMGSMMFVMSDIVGIPYTEIAKRAFIPAMIFFAAIFIQINFTSKRLGLSGFKGLTKGNTKDTIFKGLSFFLPLILLTYRILTGISPARAGTEAIVLILLISLVNGKQLFSKEKIVDTLNEGVERGTVIFALLSSASLMMGAIYFTGLTSKFGFLLSSFAESHILVLLLVLASVVIFLGLALNTLPSYMLAAIILAPVIIKQGYEPLAVHLFIAYFAATSSITPPVAMTSFVAASIANAPPLRVSWLSLKLGFVAFLLPFVFVIRPEILLYGTLLETILAIIAVFIVIYAYTIIMETISKYYRRKGV